MPKINFLRDIKETEKAKDLANMMNEKEEAEDVTYNGRLSPEAREQVYNLYL